MKALAYHRQYTLIITTAVVYNYDLYKFKLQEIRVKRSSLISLSPSLSLSLLQDLTGVYILNGSNYQLKSEPRELTLQSLLSRWREA